MVDKRDIAMISLFATAVTAVTVSCQNCFKMFDCCQSLNAIFVCKACKFTCENRVALKTHKSQSCHSPLNVEIQLRKCQNCKFQTTSEFLFGLHCHACKVPLGAKNDILHNIVSYYYCPKCDYKTLVKSILDVHFEVIHKEAELELPCLSELLTCRKCLLKCIDETQLSQHKCIQFEALSYRCNFCSFKSGNMTIVVNHLKTYVHTTKVSLEFDALPKVAQEVTVIETGHSRRRDDVHTEERPPGFNCCQPLNAAFLCQACKSTYETRMELKTHQSQSCRSPLYVEIQLRKCYNCKFQTTSEFLFCLHFQACNVSSMANNEYPTTDHVQKRRQIIKVRLNKASKIGASQDNLVPGPSELTLLAELKLIEKRTKSTEATRRWRAKKRAGRPESSKKQKQPNTLAKTPAQRMREYRARKKLAKEILLKQQCDQDLNAIVSTASS